MNIEQNKRSTEFCMRFGLVLGALYATQYMLVVLTSRNVFYSLLHTLVCFGTPILLGIACHLLRKNIFTDSFSWGRCWLMGLRVVFYGAILEAAFVVIYNKWLNPTNLFEMQQGLLNQYESLNQMMQAAENNPLGSMSEMLSQSVETLKNQTIPSPIEAGFSALSNDLVSGAFWMTILSCIFYRKNRVADQTAENNNK